MIVRCQICRLNLAKHPCHMCGKKVCSEHFDRESGLCDFCKRGNK